MDAPDCTCQVPPLHSSNGVYYPRQTEYRPSMKLNSANRPTNLPRFGTRCNVASNSMYKTEKCKNFLFKGSCNYGAMCTFAHGAEELRVMRDSDIMTCPKRKTCRYSWRNCPYGEKCVFAHEPSKQHEEIRSYLPRERSTISIEPTGGYAESKSKIRVCHRWKMDNNCAKGSDCPYVHGQAELQRATPITVSESKAEIAAAASIKETLPNEVQNSTASNKQKLEPKVCLFKWKKMKIKKIVGIYADWIDEDSLVPFLASEI